MEGNSLLCSRPSARWGDRGSRRTFDVCTSTHLPIASCSERASASFQRVYSDIRIGVRNLGMFPTSVERGCIRGRCLHHRGLLVHGLNFVRQPSGDSCEMYQ
jgi:hypothetical protein